METDKLFWASGTGYGDDNMTKKGLYANINARKKKGTSRTKAKSTVSPKAYKNMQKGFPKRKK